ncbi:MAG: recombination regulator RecX [Betaproteobacteria bacterium]|nr:recombination regulator RecX [Betaproteobacteria bacterium]MDH3436542.1 recombination regulator RecX [Betaproteobacteria bacterium]
MTGDPKTRGPSLRARALKLLARREHSRHELARKLAAHAQGPAELESVLDALEAQGWLSERRVVEQIVHARRSRFGARRIARELVEKGIGEDAVAAALQTLKEDEVESARAVWRRKFAHLPRTAAERARQVRFLQGRGFGFDAIMKVVKGEDEQ